MKKYELTSQRMNFRGRKLYRIRALKDFTTRVCSSGYSVRKGDLGGWVESEENLSQEGNCWVYDDAIVCEKSNVADNAIVCEMSVACGNSRVLQNSIVSGMSEVKDYVYIHASCEVHSGAIVNGDLDYDLEIDGRKQF